VRGGEVTIAGRGIPVGSTRHRNCDCSRASRDRDNRNCDERDAT
jgi:hypothetical protein